MVCSLANGCNLYFDWGMWLQVVYSWVVCMHALCIYTPMIKIQIQIECCSNWKLHSGHALDFVCGSMPTCWRAMPKACSSEVGAGELRLRQRSRQRTQTGKYAMPSWTRNNERVCTALAIPMRMRNSARCIMRTRAYNICMCINSKLAWYNIIIMIWYNATQYHNVSCNIHACHVVLQHTYYCIG